MGKALADQFEVCARTFAEADAALNESLSELIFAGPADRLTLTENTQPAILTMSIAVCRLLEDKGIRPAIRSPGRSRRAGSAADGAPDAPGAAPERYQSPLLPPVFETSRRARISTPFSTPFTMS